MLRPLSRRFYSDETVTVARKLLGKRLTRIIGNHQLVGRIVETEAYRGSDDPASHASGGITKRNSVMFGPPGHAYVYFTYGMHFCFNVVAHFPGTPGAVLTRAVQPIRGLELMSQRRRVNEPTRLCSGPAKLARAFAIGRSLNGHDLTIGKKLFITRGKLREGERIVCSKRIGVSAASKEPWRFYLQGSAFISRRPFSE